MSRLSRRTALLAPALAVAAALSLTACGNSGVATQSKEHSNSDGIDGQAGQVKILSASITLGTGDGSGQLAVAFFNGEQAADALTGVTSPAAAAFALPADATSDPGAYTGASPSGSPSSLSSVSTAGSTQVTSITLPAQTGVYLNAGSTQIAISGLTGSPLVGQSVPVTFTFAGAGSATLQVPIAGQADASSSFSPLPAVTAAGVANGATSSAAAGG